MKSSQNHILAVAHMKGAGTFPLPVVAMVALLTALVTRVGIAKASTLALNTLRGFKRVLSEKADITSGVPSDQRFVGFDMDRLRKLLSEADLKPALPRFPNIPAAVAFLQECQVVPNDCEQPGDALEFSMLLRQYGLTVPDGDSRRPLIADDLLAPAGSPESTSLAAKPEPKPEPPKK
jgi:hypothetical protein